MGNSACLNVTQAAAISDPELKRTREQDELCLSLLQQQFPPEEVVKVSQLDQYQVLGASTQVKKAAKPEKEELGFLCLQETPEKLGEKYKEVRVALERELRYLGTKELSADKRLKNSCLQILCRVFDALLREVERDRRSAEEARGEEKVKEKAVKEKLPPLAKAGLAFGVGLLMQLVQAVGVEKPEVVVGAIDLAASVIVDLKPMSLLSSEPAVDRSISAITTFFERLLSGAYPGLSKATELKAITVMLGLALAKGNMTSALSLVMKFMEMKEGEEWREALSALGPMLANLQGLGVAGKGIPWNWSPERQGPDILLSNENSTITRTNSSGWGSQKSEQTISSGVHYVEFNIDRNSSSCLLVGITASSTVDYTNKCAIANTWCYQADGDSYANSSSCGNMGSYTQGDRIGLLINMEDHTLIYFKNSVKTNHDPFANIATEVQLIVCFGGSDQFVTIKNDAEVPAEIEGLVNSAPAAGQEQQGNELFPSSPGSILQDATFNYFTKGEGSASPGVAAAYVLISLNSVGEGIFGPYHLDDIQHKLPKSRKLQKSNGLAVDVKPETFKYVIDILKKLKRDMERRNWTAMDFRLSAWATISALRLLRNHIFTALLLSLPESDTSLLSLKPDIKSLLAYFSALNLTTLQLPVTPENDAARDAVARQALLITLHSFELFYPSLDDKLEFIRKGLVNSVDKEPEELKLVNAMLLKVTLPINLLKAFDRSEVGNMNKVMQFLLFLLDLVTKTDLQALEEGNSVSSALNPILYTSQAVLLAEMGRKTESTEVLMAVKGYLEAVFASTERLIVKLKTKATDGTVTGSLEKLVQQTLLGSHLISLFRMLCVLPLDPEFSAFLITETTHFSSLLSGISGGPSETTTGISYVDSLYESEHPYPNSADLTKEIAVPGAVYYVLTFDSQCKTESTYDYLELFTDSTKGTKLNKWEGDTWPREPVTINQNSLYFTFHSDGGTNFWGWKISISAAVSVTVQKDSWVEDLLVALCQNPITSSNDQPTSADCQALLANRLVRSGVKDAVVAKLGKKPMVRGTLAELIASTQIDDKLSTGKNQAAALLTLTIFKSLLPKRIGAKAVLSSYLAQIGLADKGKYQYSEVPIIEELIKGSDRTITAFKELKRRSGVIGPLTNLGGTDMDQPERALFCVLLAFFELSETFNTFVTEPGDICEMLKYIIKQVNSLRQWAQLQRQKLIDATGRDVPYTEIAQGVLGKCVLLLHTEFKQTMTEIGIEKVLESLVTSMKRSPTDTDTKKISLSGKMKSSKWTDVKKTVETMGKVKTLHNLIALRGFDSEKDPTIQQEDRKQFHKVHNLIMEVLSSPLTAEQIITELEIRRNRATARCIGLNLLSMAFRAAPDSSKGELQGLISSAFSESFTFEGQKRHYSAGIEGIDPYLNACLQQAFFTLYRLLMNRIQLGVVKELDCTSEQVFQYMISTFGALCFPFEDSDAALLLDQSIREPAHLLLSWAKGQRFSEQLPKSFNRSQTITDFKVHFEGDYHASADHEAFSLHPKNRLDGEVAEDVEGQLKLALEVIRGGEKQPITDVIVAGPDAEVEGYEKIEGNINEIGDPLCLFVKREDPAETSNYLTKVTVGGWCPIQLSFQYQSHPSLMSVDTSNDMYKKRSERKLSLKRAAWLLFKFWLYSAAGRTEDQGGFARQTRRAKLQELFVELIYPELKCLPKQTESEEALELRQLLSGKNWQKAEVPLIELKTNPVAEWIEKIREDANEFVMSASEALGFNEVALIDVVTDYLSSTDPTMKGALPDSEIPEGVTDFPAEYRNSKGEVDFFCFLKHIIAHADRVLTPYWLRNVKSSPLYHNLPVDFYEAQRRLGEGSVASILSVFQSQIHMNEVESFMPYVQWFGEAETPGILARANAPKSAPKEFLNVEKNLDFFVTLKAIKDHPEQFPAYFREIKPLLSTYEALPASCLEFYKARLSPSQAEYQASLLVLLYQCCNSKGMLAILAQPQHLVELMKHMLIGSLKSSNIAFRIVREIVYSEHSPDSFDAIWAAFPKGKLRAEYGNEVAKDLINVLLCFIGIHQAVHIKSWKFSFLTLQKIEILSHESISFLHKLSKSDRWRDKIATICGTFLHQALSNIPTESGSEIVIGCLGYLRSFEGHRHLSLHEWTKIELKGAGVSEGVLVRIKAGEGKLKLYCEGDDEMHVEGAEFFSDTLSDRPIALFNKLPESIVLYLFEHLTQLIPLLDDPIYNMVATTAESRLNNAAVRRLVQSSCLEVLGTICECEYRLDFQGVGRIPEFASGLIKSLGRDPQLHLNYGLYEELRKLLYVRHSSRVASQVKSSVVEIIGEHAESNIVAKYNEEKQILVATLKSIGLAFVDIKEALEQGCTDTESVLKYVEQRNAAKLEKESMPTDNMLLYRLSKNEKNPPIFRDNSGKASFIETPRGHLCLQALRTGPEDLDEPKYLLKLFDEGVFGSLETPPDELTLLAAIGFTDKVEECTFGFIIGKISLTLKVSKEKMESGSAERNYFFRMFLQFNGHCVVVNEGSGEKVLESDDAFSFEDIVTTKFGLFLSSYGKVEVKGVALFNGHFTGTPSYWEEETDLPIASPGRLVTYRLAPVNQTIKALNSGLGLPIATATQVAKKYPELKRAVGHILSEPAQVEGLNTDFGTYVEDLIVVNSVADLPPGYLRTSIYFQGSLSTDYSAYTGPILALKSTSSRGLEFLKGLEWKETDLSIIKEEKGTGAGVASVLIIRSTNPLALELPAGYQLVTVNGEAVNLTPDTGKWHFLGYRTLFTIRGQPFTDLGQMPKQLSDDGLVDVFPMLSAAASADSESKTIAEEVQRYSSQSSVQLQTKVFAMEKACRSQAAFRLVLKLMKRWSNCVTDPRQLGHLLECSGQKYELLEEAINAVLERGEIAQILGNVMLADVVTQLIKPAFTAGSTTSLRSKTITYESPHPYENNTDKSEEIRIPGAKRMVITFDPLCKSEANYDYLQFAKDKDYQAEICKLSGSTWTNFEFEGDTLYFKFHSDGSNNEWGYKFTVVATVAVSEGIGSADDVARALWILEKVVFSRTVLPSFLVRFLDKEVQNALNLFVHTAPEPDQSLQALFLLKKLLVTGVEPATESQEIAALLAQETLSLYRDESLKSDKSQLLKHICGLLVEIKDKFAVVNTAEWLESFYETYSFMKGIESKDENFQFLLLKQFLDLKGRSLDITRESSHPYSTGFASKEVYSRGATSLNVEFAKESEAEGSHAMLFSKDLAGAQAILHAGGSSASQQEVLWSSSPAGPNIAVSNGGKTVTRTDSSGWGNAIFTEQFSAGKLRINLKVDSHDGGGYLYIGVWAVGSYPLSSCTYKDLDYQLWTYKVAGEFHKKGFSAEVSGSAFSTGDEVSICLDFDEHTITFFKNNEQKYQFTDLVGPVTGVACFGGTNQNISILSVQNTGADPTKLSELKINIPGERFFYHYPVNAGYLGLIYAAWKPDKALAFSNENKTASRAAGNAEPIAMYTAGVLREGRQFLEVKITAVTTVAGLSFGIGTANQPLSIAYQADGVLKKLGETFICESYGKGDSVALLLNTATSELRVYKNSTLVTTLARTSLEQGKDYRWAVTLGDGGTVDIVTNGALVETLVLMGRNGTSTQAGKYGYKFTVSPLYVGKNKKLAFETLGNLESEWKTYYSKQKAIYSKEVCEQLVNYVDEKAAITGKDPVSLTPEDISPTPQELLHYDLLEKLQIDDIRGVFRFILDLNLQVSTALPLISLDLQELSKTTELQRLFLSLRSSLFLSPKMTKLKGTLGKTNSSERPTIEVNRTRATRQREKGLMDSQGVSSIFGQIYRLMNKASNRSLRNEERIFQVNFTGEGSIDAGGPYNEVISNICEELQSKYLPLLVQCPNGVQNLGENRECWVPNPGANSGIHMDMFRFIGKLFGVAIRTQNNLNLSLPPIFWKRLLFHEVTTQDVKSYDECIYQTIDILRHMPEQGITPDTFQSAFTGEVFTTKDSGGQVVDLIPNGKNVDLMYQNALEFANALERQRMTEAESVYAAIRTGMSAIIPLNLLFMFSWKQVETLVCGAADINVDVLKGNTVYEGLTADTPAVQMLWDVLKEMSPKERSLFLRFVWGRTRLPSGKNFKQFKITSKSVSGNPDKYLPVSHTCFFTLDLPGYSSKEILKEKMLYAVTHCQAIDLDRVAGAEGWEDE
jgi:hypothetical protein